MKRVLIAGLLWAGSGVMLSAEVLAQAASAPETSGGAPQQAISATQSSERGVIRTFYLRSATSFNDGSEVTAGLRNIMDPRTKIYYVPSRGAVVVEATPEQITLAERLVNDLDRPRKGYRITYTVSEMDGGKRVGVQHYTVEVVAGQRATLKQGSKVPIVTGTYDAGKSQTQTQVTYLDVGLNFDVTLDESDAGVQLKNKVEQSSIAEERSGIGPQDPVVRQTVLEGISRVQIGKPLVIGQLDIPGSTRHLAIEVLVEPEKL